MINPEKRKSSYYDVAFSKYDEEGNLVDYKGTLRFVVRHPKFKNELRVAAPTEEAAIVAATNYWGERWQSYSFYPYCEVTKG